MKHKAAFFENASYGFKLGTCNLRTNIFPCSLLVMDAHIGVYDAKRDTLATRYVFVQY